MSSEGDNPLEQNAVMCYFPWFPYYHRYQIGFDIVVNPPDAQEDPSVEGERQRLIHVQLHFPDGIICGPANFGGMLHTPPFRGDVSHFFPPHPLFHPPMYPTFPHETQHFQHHVSMSFHESMMWQGQCDSRMIVNVVNGQPGEFMAIDDTEYDVIPQCEECGEFHREPDHVHNKRSQDVPTRKPSQQLRKQSARAGRRTSTSGTTGQSATVHAAPRTVDECVAADPGNGLQNQNIHNLTQQMGNINIRRMKTCSQSTAATNTKEMSRLAMGSQNNAEYVAEDNKTYHADTSNDNDSLLDYHY